MANGRYVFLILILLALAGCHSRYEFIELYDLPPRTDSKLDYWDHILKQTSYNDTKISTMILIDDLLISDELTDKYHINLIYRQTVKDSTILLTFYHEGYDLLHINKTNESLMITADSLEYKFKAAKTDKDEETFIYQCFQRSGITVQVETIYYEMDSILLSELLNSNSITIELIGKKHKLSSKLNSKTLGVLRRFYNEVIHRNLNYIK